ncbi:MAG: response regulator [Spirulinaceae cyanobacterium SM2_1_0]|nr:response regulator [Spirulinaceae cyanobacterium SM2_1_0]
MSAQSSSLTRLVQAAAKLYRQEATGCLIIAAGKQQWQIYFYAGQIAYAVGQTHRVRRWQRALQQQQVTLTSQAPVPAEPWEYAQLLRGVKQKQISPAKAQAVIQASLQEVLFAIAMSQDLQCRWRTGWSLARHAHKVLTVPVATFKQAIRETERLQAQWQTLKLQPAYVNAAPLLQNCPLAQSSASQISLRPLLNGKRTVWDLAVRMKLSLAGVARLLHYYIQRGSIEFKILRDRPAPVTVQAATTKRPLVVCVDDSAQICHQVKCLLSAAGYRCLTFQDSTQALPALVQQPPDLILLDLVMPVVNGYELCAHLRRVPSLTETPIALMTGNKGLVDRLRAKLVGANDLILKPLDRERLLALIHRQLQPQSSPQTAEVPAHTAFLQPAMP